MHWNFFFTLAAVALLTALVPLQDGWMGLGFILITLMHQLLLSYAGATDVIHSNVRSHTLFSLNKEGILSIPGYWSLHLAGVLISRILLWSSRMALNRTQRWDCCQFCLIHMVIDFLCVQDC